VNVIFIKVELINSGVSGNTSTQRLERIEKDILTHGKKE
jgi:hypothetical protein